VFVMPWWIPLVLLAAALVIWVRLRTRRSADGEVVEQYET
jgi:cytochrome c-type biogenesis protein CcmH/NrfF